MRKKDEAALIREAMAALGRRKSPRKAASSAKNGRKGGHPSLFHPRKPTLK